jgi:hypothetical protein
MTDDLDQLATMEWVKQREEWRACNDKASLVGADINVCCYAWKDETTLVVADIAHRNPTRRQIIAAETFAKEMGWV